MPYLITFALLLTAALCFLNVSPMALIKRLNNAQQDARGWLEQFLEQQKEGRQNTLKQRIDLMQGRQRVNFWSKNFEQARKVLSAACIISNTTVQSESVEAFEAAYLALQLKQIVGVPIDDAQYARAAESYMQIPDRSVNSLDEALTRCQRANVYVGKELKDMYRGFMQAQGMDLSMLGTQVAQNFIQDLS